MLYAFQRIRWIALWVLCSVFSLLDYLSQTSHSLRGDVQPVAIGFGLVDLPGTGKHTAMRCAVPNRACRESNSDVFTISMLRH
jgi:hypothetical protein